jgi:NitT/TauT family transport system substrate-binding protein
MLIARKELMLPLFAATLALSVGASKDAVAAVGDPDTITCAYPVWVGFGPVHLANELGYFAEEGITVEEILDDDMPNAIAAMERGDIDCYRRTWIEVIGAAK